MQHTEETIEIIGARAHNLKNIDVTIPREKLVVIGFW
jgi:excinuclease ABC subunit A